MMCGGSAAHADHTRHMVHIGEMMVAGKAPDYQITDKDKLYAVADRIGVSREGKSDEEIFSEGQIAKQDLCRFETPSEPPATWLDQVNY